MYVWTDYVAHILLPLLSLFIWNDYTGGSDIFFFFALFIFSHKEKLYVLKTLQMYFFIWN